MDGRGERDRRVYAVYTAAFFVLCAGVFCWFFLSGKTFVWNPDGLAQHYRALLYYSGWLRELFRGIFIAHDFRIPSYSFSIGYGTDIVTTLHYYVIGDPFAFFSLFVPERYLVYYYDGMLLLRLYLAGLSFLWYIRDKANPSDMGAVAGAVSWVFCGYALYAPLRHPFFANPMIYLPLLLLGVERYRREKKSGVFLFAVFLAGISNFYFFWMLVLMTIFYVVFHLFLWYGKAQIKEAAAFVGGLFMRALAGTMMSAVLLLPMVHAILSGSRSAKVGRTMLFWDAMTVKKILFAFINWRQPGWTCLDFSGICLLAIFLMFLGGRKNRHFILAFILMTLALFLPAFGKMMGGFSYASNRWNFAYTFFVCCMVAVFWEELRSVTQKKALLSGGVFLIFLGCCVLLERDVTLNECITAGFAAVILAAPLWARRGSAEKRARRERIAGYVICLCVAGNIFGMAFCGYSPWKKNYAGEFAAVSEVDWRQKQEDAVLAFAASDEFCRYSGDKLEHNTAMFYGLHGTDYYWSIADKRLGEYYGDMALTTNSVFNVRYLDGRTPLLEKSGVQYYVTNREDKLPYGYTVIGTEGKQVVGSTEDALPFACLVTDCAPMSDLKGMTPLARQEAMSRAVFVETDETVGTYESAESLIAEADITFACEDGVMFSGGRFVVTMPEWSGDSGEEDEEEREEPVRPGAVAEFEKRAGREAYCYIEGLSCDVEGGGGTLAFTWEDGGRTLSDTLSWYAPENSGYSGRENFLIPLGYADEAGTMKLTVRFSCGGIWRFDKFNILYLPPEPALSAIRALPKAQAADLDFHENGVYATDCVTGNIIMETDGFLRFSFPYSDGWKLTVDGTEETLLPADYLACGVFLPAGKHEILLTYRTPWLLQGAVLSLAGVLLAVYFLFDSCGFSLGKKSKIW